MAIIAVVSTDASISEEAAGVTTIRNGRDLAGLGFNGPIRCVELGDVVVYV